MATSPLTAGRALVTIPTRTMDTIYDAIIVGNGMLGAAALLAEIIHQMHPEKYPGALFTLLSGGLLLGAVFMACTAAAVLVLTMFTLSPCLVNRFSFSAMKYKAVPGLVPVWPTVIFAPWA